MHEIISLTVAASKRTRPFSLERIRPARFLAADKGPDKSVELRAHKPEPTSPRLAPAERTGLVEKWARHALRKAAKVRLFRMFKLFDPAVDEGEPGNVDAFTRPFAEHLTWLRRSRRL